MIKLTILSILLISLLFGTNECDDWPMYHHDPQRTGYTSIKMQNQLEVSWKYETGDDVKSSPAVVNNKVYIGSLDNHIYCLDAETGELIWKYETGDDVKSSPAVVNNKVYIGSLDNHIYCLDAETGELIWKKKSISAMSSPAVVNNKVYIGSWDDHIYCLDAETGELIWKFKAGNDVKSSPAVINNKVYIGSWDDHIYCLDAETGELIWKYEAGDNVESPTATDNKVYIGSWDNHIYCLDAETGELIWKKKTEDELRSSPAIADGKVYIASLNNHIYCLDAETGELAWEYEAGELAWEYEAGEVLRSSPAITDGKVYIGCFYLYCLDAETGELINRYYSFGFGIISSSPALANGKVYVGSCDDKIYCFRGKEISRIFTPAETLSSLSNRSTPFIYIWLFFAAMTSVIIAYMIDRVFLKKTEKIFVNENMPFKKFRLASIEIDKKRFREIVVVVFICFIFFILSGSLSFWNEMIGKSTLTRDPEVDPLIMEFYNARVKNFSILVSFLGFSAFVLFLIFAKTINLIMDFLGFNVIDKYFLKSWRTKKDYVFLNASIENSVALKILKYSLIILIIIPLIFMLFVSHINESVFCIFLIVFYLIILLIYSMCLIKIGLSKKITPKRLMKLFKINSLEHIAFIFFLMLLLLPSFFLITPLIFSVGNMELSVDNTLKENFVNDFELIISKKESNIPPWYLWTISQEVEYFDPKLPFSAQEVKHLLEISIFLVLIFILILGVSFAIPVLYFKGYKVIYSLLISFSVGIFLTRVIFWYFSQLSFIDFSSWVIGIIFAFITFLLKKWFDSVLKDFEMKINRKKN